MITRTRVRYDRATLLAPDAGRLWARVGGMTVLERRLFTLSRAGARVVRIETPRPEAARLAALRLPPELELLWAGAPLEAPYAAVWGDRLVRAATYAAVLGRPHERSTRYEDERGAPVLDVLLAPEDEPAARERLPAGSSVRLDAADDSALLDWLMQAGPKAQDGFMARHFDRHISGAVSRALLDTPVTPNQMTIASTLIGLAGAAFFLGPSRRFYVLGALLVWLHSVLDGCDGELARVRFQESPLGADIDFWGDNLVHLALFTSLGVGFWLGHNGPHTLALAAVADAGVLASAFTAWRLRLERRAAGERSVSVVVEDAAGDGLESKLSKLENALAQRDFIYLLVVLAFLDRVYEFLWAAAIGGLLYFGIMLYLRRVNEHEQPRQPYPAR